MMKGVNQGWSEEENATVQFLLQNWKPKLNYYQFQQLEAQVKQFSNCSEVIILLLNSKQDWNQLQNIINAKIKPQNNDKSMLMSIEKKSNYNNNGLDIKQQKNYQQSQQGQTVVNQIKQSTFNNQPNIFYSQVQNKFSAKPATENKFHSIQEPKISSDSQISFQNKTNFQILNEKPKMNVTSEKLQKKLNQETNNTKNKVVENISTVVKKTQQSQLEDLQQQNLNNLKQNTVTSASNKYELPNLHNQKQELVNQELENLFIEFKIINSLELKNEFNLLVQTFESIKNQQEKTSESKFSEGSELTSQDLLILSIGVKQNFQYYPRGVQLLSVILLYDNQKNLGRLAQIYTGEGKTLIVAMLAVLLVKKKNQNVDIITSSAVLAIRDSEQYAKFYEHFSISISHNIHKNEVIKDGMHPCYKSQIIYGDASSFQSDILRHEYSEQGTLGDRKSEYAIVDEVDSMLIDGHQNKTLLSSPIPGMLDLSKILTLIWDEICKVSPHLSTDLQVMITDKDDFYSVDLDEYIEQTLDNQLKSGVDTFIPQFRLKYIHHMKKTWIKNAIAAMFQLKIDKDYIVNDGIVRIVDFQNTGIIQSGNSQWEKGIHQFIQLKHKLNVTPLSITTNYMSNVSFFKRYKTKLLGLTGTLGSLNNQNLLAKKYNLDFIFIPPFRKRLLKEELGVALQSEDEWLNEIKKVVEDQMNKNRAVLIINRTIQEAETIEQMLRRQNANVQKYTDDNQVISKDIGPKGLVVATNLAGRGTDFITNQELEENGGLHVILSFLPQNIRIQEQGFGRTSRQGKKGTAQLIVQFKKNLYSSPLQKFQNYGEAIKYFQEQTKLVNFTLIDVVKYFRDQNEKFIIEGIEKEMERLFNEDQCFEKFCQISKSKVDFKKNRSSFRSLEEKWGLYLELNQEKGPNIDEIERNLNSEEDSNPKYLILQGLELGDVNLIQKAADIQKNDPQAHYYKGLLELENEKYQQGVESLALAKQLLQSKIEDERGFATASKLNRIQIEQYGGQDQLFDFKEQKATAPIENFEKMKGGVFKQPDTQNLGPMQLKENIQKHVKSEQKNDVKLKQNQKEVKKDAIEEKVNNHIKVYQKVIDNIDDIVNTLQNFNPEKEELDLSWVPVLENDEQMNYETDQAIKDQKEVINDGPLPRLAKITKKQKETSGWQYLGLFLLGLCQFAIGCALSFYTCGAAMPIAKCLIEQGINDMILSSTSYFNDIDIDWSGWRKQKLISFSTALSLAGPKGIKEALSLGGSAIKSLKEEKFEDFMQKMPDVFFGGLEKAGCFLTDEQKMKIENSNQTMQQIQQISNNQQCNQNQLLQQSEGIIQDQLNQGNITSQVGNEISQLVTQSLSQAQQNNSTFQDVFSSMASKYLNSSIGRSKAQQLYSSDQNEITQLYQKQCNQKYSLVKNEIDDFKQYQSRLSNEINIFTKIFWNCFSQDQELQKQLIIFDLQFEYYYDLQKFQSRVNESSIQKLIRQNFDVTNRHFQEACKSLIIANKQSMFQFYSKAIKPSIVNVVNQFQVNKKFCEPFQIVLELQLKKQLENLSDNLQLASQQLQNQQYQLNQQSNNQNFLQNPANVQAYNENVTSFNQQFQEYESNALYCRTIDFQNMNVICQKICQNLIKKKQILGYGLNFSNAIVQELSLELQYYKNNPIQYQLFQDTFQNAIQWSNIIYEKCQKVFSNLLKSAVELQILDEVKKYLFQSKMRVKDENIQSILNF